MSTKYNNGKHEWTHNDPIYEGGRIVRRLKGPCPRCGGVTVSYGSAYSCNNWWCQNNSGVFACRPDREPDWWNTGVSVQKDGNSWCATRHDFINLQESDAGFGDTIKEAVDDLRAC